MAARISVRTEARERKDEADSKAAPARGRGPCEAWWGAPIATRGAPFTTPLRAAVPVPVPGRIVEAVLMNPDLTVIWAFIIAFAVAAYVVMDGFDLGIGILFPRFTVGKERDQAMNAVAPVWDGNET